jgi:CBS domain-containing protein
MADPTPPTKSGEIHRSGRLGEGGDTRHGRAKKYRKPDPDKRPTELLAEATNRDRPAAPGERISDPGEGIAGAGSRAGGPSHRPKHAKALAPGAVPPHTPPPEQAGIDMGIQDPVKDGINRVEFDESIGSPRLSVPDERVGPEGDRSGVPGLHDPNFTAASQHHRGKRGGKTAPTERNRHGAAKVRDVMTADVESATPDTRLYYVARMMADRGVGAIPIVESTDTMKPVGIVTDRDIVVRVIAKNEDPYTMNAGACMTGDPLTVKSETDLTECLRQMEQRQVRRVVVVDDAGRCIGIVAQADVALNVSREKTGELVKDVSEPTERGD